MLPVIDTHQHLWDLSRFRLPWLDSEPALARSYLMEEYLQESAGLQVVRTVYMEVDVEPSQHVAEAEYVIALCERADNPMAGAVIGGRPAAADFAAYLDRFRGVPYIKGVRQVLHGSTPAGYCLTPEFVRGLRLLGERGLCFDLCMRPEELADGARLIALCPETRFVLDHCGNAPMHTTDRAQWQRDIAAIARQENVVCKISGIVAQLPAGQWTPEDLAPVVQHCADVFGPDRILYASDWPVCTLSATFREWLYALQTIVAEWPEENQRKLFHDNAARFYAL
ncbi:MAG: amidohydrolase family protein [Chloroherpetonaceae bacterium]|nr:amidohydrolase family protein [Chloroherpetonaceae bacterium]